MTRRIALLAMAIASSFAASAIAGAQSAGQTAAGCATRNLVVWLDTNGDAAAGSVHYELEFTNLSTNSCVLRGYPRVSAVDLAGRGRGAQASRNASNPVRPIVLAPGGSASAALKIADTDVFPSPKCVSTTAAGLRVYPPNQTASRIVPYPFRACSKPGPVYLQVGAVTASKRP